MKKYIAILAVALIAQASYGQQMKPAQAQIAHQWDLRSDVLVAVMDGIRSQIAQALEEPDQSYHKADPMSFFDGRKKEEVIPVKVLRERLAKRKKEYEAERNGYLRRFKEAGK